MYGNNDKYIKTKIKAYGDKINSVIEGKKVSKENASYKCLSLIMLDSIIRVNEKYYPQTLLEEFKYQIKKNKMKILINYDLDLSSSDNDSHLFLNAILLKHFVKGSSLNVIPLRIFYQLLYYQLNQQFYLLFF